MPDKSIDMATELLVANEHSTYIPIELLTCKKCGCCTLNVFWALPPPSCAGGTLYLKCPNCQFGWTHYDDYA